MNNFQNININLNCAIKINMKKNINRIHYTNKKNLIIIHEIFYKMKRFK